MKLRHIALFSQTGSEIADLIDRDIKPDLIIFDQKDESKIDSRIIDSGLSEQIPKKLAKDVSYLRNRFGASRTCFITLHGWLNIIPKEICDEYEIYNGHPGLITKFPELKGKDPQLKAFEGNYDVVGSVIHQVTPGVDEGPVAFERAVDNNCDTLDDMFTTLKAVSLDLWLDFFKT